MQLFDLRSGRLASVYFTIIVVGLLLAPLACLVEKRAWDKSYRYDISGSRLPRDVVPASVKLSKTLANVSASPAMPAE